MSFWDKAKKFFNPFQQTKGNSWEGPHYNFSSWANTPFFGLKNQDLTTNEEVFSVVTRLANTVSSLPLHEYKKYQQTSTSVSNLLTVEPNPSMTSFQLLNQLETSRNVDGNGYLWIERDDYGLPQHLWPVDPKTVVVKRDVETGNIWYQISSETYNFLVFNTEIIHVKHISPLSDFVGISPLDVLSSSLKFARTVEEFSMNEMDKKDAYIIQYDRSVSDGRRKALMDDFRRMIKENGGAILQEQGFKIDRYESKFQPGDLQTVSNITKQRIANAFNVPLSFLDNGNTNNAKSSESIMTQFVEMTLKPIIKQYEAEFNRKLLTQNQRARGYYFKFNINGLMRGDTASRTSFYAMMIRNGIATPNELRKLEDLPETKDKNADKLWFSKDLALLEDADKFSKSTDIKQVPQLKGGDNPDDDSQNEDAKLSNNQAGSENKQYSRHVY
ncbi:MAG: phage portal protein [Lactobacillus johnsonii]|nr:phage portal protein [Lactobacillus johnsonii]